MRRYLIVIINFRNGGQGWNRTSDTGIFSPLLYRLSYLAMEIASRVLNR